MNALTGGLAVVALTVTACGGDGGDGTADPGRIVVSGSSTVEPISIAAALAFSERDSSIAVSVDGPGTGDGFARFCAGETDISDASRPITDEEVATCEDNGISFIELPVAVDGLSVITSAENDAIECLSFVDLWALIGPDALRVDNWAEASATADDVARRVDGFGAVHTPFPDADLTVVAPGEESGTFDSFVEIVLDPVGEALGADDRLPRLDYTASPNDNVIIEGIAANPTSLGWIGFAFVDANRDAIRPIAIDGGAGCVSPSPATIASGEFPIARTLYIYVNAERAETDVGLAAFVDFYLDEGITTLIGPDAGQVPFVPLAATDAEAVRAVWDARQTGSRAGDRS